MIATSWLEMFGVQENGEMLEVSPLSLTKNVLLSGNDGNLGGSLLTVDPGRNLEQKKSVMEIALINQSISQSINQSINQSVSQSIIFSSSETWWCFFINRLLL